jgi:F0F1-type ATP synthase assembly protein I
MSSSSMGFYPETSRIVSTLPTKLNEISTNTAVSRDGYRNCNRISITFVMGPLPNVIGTVIGYLLRYPITVPITLGRGPITIVIDILLQFI